MSLLTFFIVFYGQQSYQRYYMFYGDCTAMSGAVMEWTAMVRRHIGHDPGVMWNATRLMLAAHHIVFGELDGSVQCVAAHRPSSWPPHRTRPYDTLRSPRARRLSQGA